MRKILLTIISCFTILTTPVYVNAENSYNYKTNITTKQNDEFTLYIDRLYTYLLGRKGTKSEKQYWINKVYEGELTAQDVAIVIFNSPEFRKIKMSNNEYLERLANAILSRRLDYGAKGYFSNQIAKGMTRRKVLEAFLKSNEAEHLFNRFELPTVDKRNDASAFVERLYANVLGRKSDKGGLKYWLNQIASGKQTYYSVATNGFFHSNEFKNKKLNNRKFVEICYQTFLDRKYDINGLNYWLNALNKGKSRDYVISGFANSTEFKQLMKKYGAK